MIRGTLCLMLVVLSLFLATPSSIHDAASSDPRNSNPLLGPIIGTSDPVNGTLAAFNASLAQVDLYTQGKASESYGNFANNTRPNPGSPPGNLTWFSNINNSQGAPVSGTGFKFVSNGTISQSINWTLNIAKGSVGSTTYLRFDWNGTLTKGTNARYLLYNATATVPFLATNRILNVTKTGPPYPVTVQGGPPLNSTGGIPLACGTNEECFDLSRYIGFNITLAFIFNSNSTGKGVKFQVSNIEVASTATPFQSGSNFMLLNPGNSTEVIHSANLSVTYNSTVTYHKPNTTNGNLTHTWAQMVLTFYLPASYKLTGINLNTTALPISQAFSQGLCSATGCTNSRFLALNMTITKIFTSTAVVLAKSLNAVTSIRTTQQGVPTDFLVSGDPLQVQVVNAQGVNVTGNDVVTAALQGASATQFNQTFAVSRPGPIFDNFTGGLPTTPLGNWNVTGIFKNGYDYGILSHRFRLEQIQVSSLSSGGSNTALNLQGVLSYGSSNSAAAGVNGVVFAVDAGSPSNSPITTLSSNTPSNGLYISNMTLVNGIFTQASQPLVLIFTVVNATSQAFSGNVTIQHEWSNSQTHGVTVTFPLTLGDQPFKASKVFPYRADISFTDNGLQAKLTSLTTQNSKTLMMSTGSTPVLSSRQHTGIFKIIIGSNSTSGSFSSSLESSPYAYVPGLPLAPSRYVSSQPFTTVASGMFSATLSSSQTPILGSKRLVLFALARDSNGIALVNNSQNPGLTDSTTLLTTLDSIGQVTVGQSVQATLHLTSNSTRITMNITVNLSLQGSAIVQSQTVTITPGATKTLTFPFTAPQTPGQYLVTFSSPQYAGIFATQTLQVGLLQNYLQILLPALIGLVAAIIVLGFYLIRKGSDREPTKEEKRKSPGPKPKSEPKPALPAGNP